MATAIDRVENFPTIIPQAGELLTEAQELRQRATQKRVLATQLQKEARDLELAAAFAEKRARGELFALPSA